jgi:hypothetical protein
MRADFRTRWNRDLDFGGRPLWRQSKQPAALVIADKDPLDVSHASPGNEPIRSRFAAAVVYRGQRGAERRLLPQIVLSVQQNMLLLLKTEN